MFDNPHNQSKIILLTGSLLLLLVIVTVMTILFTPVVTVTAQNQPFVTNTPSIPDPLLRTVETSQDNYALRLWTEQDMLEILISQLNRLTAGESTQNTAIKFTLHELEYRFPGAPHQVDQQWRVIQFMLATPPGSVDMRSIVRPYIIAKLNSTNSQIRPDMESTIEINGFNLQIMPLNLDGVDPMDAVIHVNYASADGVTIYSDFLPAIGHENGGYYLPLLPSSLPAAPFDGIVSISQARFDDVNLDTLDEIAISIDRGDINDQIVIYGWRNGNIVELVSPDHIIAVGELLDWSPVATTLTVAVYQTEAPAWNCQSVTEITWDWNANFYRPTAPEIINYRQLDTLGCALHSEGSIFSMPPADAVQLVSAALEAASTDDPGYDRAAMALAMLYYLNGETRTAESMLADLLPLAGGNPWLNGQLNTFAIAISGNFYAPIETCEALTTQSEYGACNLEEVLLRLFTENRLSQDADLLQQLEMLGLQVLETTTISQVGYLDRIAVEIDLMGGMWWAFAPSSNGYYTPEVIDTPPGFEDVAFPLGQISPPEAVYEEFFVNGNKIGVLNAFDILIRNNPGLPLSSEARYIQALSYDFIADRQHAHEAFFELWSDYPHSIWGQLAGAHLERR
jgi:hypothetical protein